MSSGDNIELGDVKEEKPMIKKKSYRIDRSGEDNTSLSPSSHTDCSCTMSSTSTFHGLTKEELLKIDSEEKIWRTLRIGLLILFWIIWISTLVAAVLIVYLSPTCAVKKDLTYWQKEPIYRLNPFTYKDSNNDNVGDFVGILSKLEYISKNLKYKTIILDQFLRGVYGKLYRNLASHLEDVDEKLGTLEDLRQLVKKIHREDMNIILTIDINGLSAEHPWLKEKPYLFKQALASKPIGRNGLTSTCTFNEKEFYSSMGSLPNNKGECLYVDLDYSHNETFQSIANVTRFWLQDVGVDGLLLTNVAFFSEEDGSEKYQLNAGTDNKNAFFNGPSSQLYSSNSLNIVRRLRKEVFDPINSGGGIGRKKALFVEAGDVGVGIPHGQVSPLVELTIGETPAADLVLLPEFYFRRGFKSENAIDANTKINILNYWTTLSSANLSVGLATASPYDIRHNSVEALLGVMLGTGCPVVQSGSELGSGKDLNKLVKTSSLDGSAERNFDYFPRASRSLVYLGANENTYEQDILNDGMFPWTETLTNASEEYKSFFMTGGSLQLNDAVAAPPSLFSLTKKLSVIRTQSPSLLWGDMKMIMQTITDNSRFIIFSRNAKGFPSIIVVFSHNSSVKGRAVSFSDVCERGNMILSYPHQSQILDKEVDLSNVYIDLSALDTVYVFKCVD